MNNPQIESTLEPMYLRRPNWLEERIDIFYDQLEPDKSGYFFEGKNPNYCFNILDDEFNYASITTDDLIDELEARKQRKLRILDIGAAIGGFVLDCQSKGHDAIALSAHNYLEIEEKTRELKESSYIVGDANRLQAVLVDVEPFDLITSSHTLRHLVDPVGVLEQAVGLLRSGGTLAVGALNTTISNEFFITSPGVNFSWVSDWLSAASYSVEGGEPNWRVWPGEKARVDVVIKAPSEVSNIGGLPIDYVAFQSGLAMSYVQKYS